MPINGLVVMTPTSIASTGTGNSSSINADGSVDFSSCATLQLNGVFTSSYDNYMIVMRTIGTNSNDSLSLRFATGGTTTSDSTYTQQYLSAISTTISGTRVSTQSQARVGNLGNVLRGGDTVYLFGPYLAQRTALRNTNVYDFSSAGLVDFACTHGTSTSYDGVWFQVGAGTFTGLMTVFGFNQ